MTTSTPRVQTAHPARKYTTITPFDARRSLALDALIVQLDAQPGTLRTAWLRLRKRVLEPRMREVAE